MTDNQNKKANKANKTNKDKTLVIVIISFLLFIILFLIFAPKVESKVEEVKEQKRLDGILEQINERYIINEEYTNEWNRLESEQIKLHDEAELNREEIKKLWNEYYKQNDTGNVMGVICDKAPDSPMCNNYELLEDLKSISEQRGVDYRLLLGIMYAESHIGSYFVGEGCNLTNNWAGVKARKYDNGSVSEWFDKQEGKIDGCWLYNFDTVQDFFESLSNTISLGYAKCNVGDGYDVYCISRVYVGHESGSWVNNVYKFYSLK